MRETSELEARDPVSRIREVSPCWDPDPRGIWEIRASSYSFGVVHGVGVGCGRGTYGGSDPEMEGSVGLYGGGASGSGSRCAVGSAGGGILLSGGM